MHQILKENAFQISKLLGRLKTTFWWKVAFDVWPLDFQLPTSNLKLSSQSKNSTGSQAFLTSEKAFPMSNFCKNCGEKHLNFTWWSPHITMFQYVMVAHKSKSECQKLFFTFETTFEVWKWRVAVQTSHCRCIFWQLGLIVMLFGSCSPGTEHPGSARENAFPNHSTNCSGTTGIIVGNSVRVKHQWNLSQHAISHWTNKWLFPIHQFLQVPSSGLCGRAIGSKTRAKNGS